MKTAGRQGASHHGGSSSSDVSAGGAALRSDLGFQLGLVHHRLRDCWAETIADLGLTPPQAAVLRAITEGDSCGLRALARSLGTDAMNARRLVDHLEQVGLVYSSPDPAHSQRHVIRSTPVGVSVSDEVARRAAAVGARLRRLLGDDDLDDLLGLLGRLQGVLDDLVLPPERGEACAPPLPERND